MQLACSIELMMDTSLVHCIPPMHIAFTCKFPNGVTTRQLLCSASSLPYNSWPLIGRQTRLGPDSSSGGGGGGAQSTNFTVQLNKAWDKYSLKTSKFSSSNMTLYIN